MSNYDYFNLLSNSVEINNPHEAIKYFGLTVLHKPFNNYEASLICSEYYFNNDIKCFTWEHFKQCLRSIKTIPEHIKYGPLLNNL